MGCVFFFFFFFCVLRERFVEKCVQTSVLRCCFFWGLGFWGVWGFVGFFWVFVGKGFWNGEEMSFFLCCGLMLWRLAIGFEFL